MNAFDVVGSRRCDGESKGSKKRHKGTKPPFEVIMDNVHLKSIMLDLPGGTKFRSQFAKEGSGDLPFSPKVMAFVKDLKDGPRLGNIRTKLMLMQIQRREAQTAALLASRKPVGAR